MAVRRYTPQNYYRGAGVNLSQGRYLRALADFSSQLGGIAAEKRLEHNVADATARGMTAEPGERATGGGAESKDAFNKAARDMELSTALADVDVQLAQIEQANYQDVAGFQAGVGDYAETVLPTLSPDIRAVAQAEIAGRAQKGLIDVGGRAAKRLRDEAALKSQRNYEARIATVSQRARNQEDVTADTEILYADLHGDSNLSPAQAQKVQDEGEIAIAYSSAAGVVESFVKSGRPDLALTAANKVRSDPRTDLTQDEKEKLADRLEEVATDTIKQLDTAESVNDDVLDTNAEIYFQQDFIKAQTGQLTEMEIRRNRTKYRGRTGDMIAAAQQRKKTILDGDPIVMNGYSKQMIAAVNANDFDAAHQIRQRAWADVEADLLSVGDYQDLLDMSIKQQQVGPKVEGIDLYEYDLRSRELEVMVRQMNPITDATWLPGPGGHAYQTMGIDKVNQDAAVAKANRELFERVKNREMTKDGGARKSVAQISLEIAAKMDLESNGFDVVRPTNPQLADIVGNNPTEKTLEDAKKTNFTLFDKGFIDRNQYAADRLRLAAMKAAMDSRERIQKTLNIYNTQSNIPTPEFEGAAPTEAGPSPHIQQVGEGYPR